MESTNKPPEIQHSSSFPRKSTIGKVSNRVSNRVTNEVSKQKKQPQSTLQGRLTLNTANKEGNFKVVINS